MGPWTIVIFLLALLGALFLLTGVWAIQERRFLRAVPRVLLGLLWCLLAVLVWVVGISIRGYRALTREVVAATVVTKPVAPALFRASFTFPDGRDTNYLIHGNALYVDAHIVKWHPWVNILGLHTGYELDRVGGRYDSLVDEKNLPRSIESLRQPKPVDIYDVAHRFPFLKPLVDTEYGSATFIGAEKPDTIEIRVSTTGLLARRKSGS